MDAHDQAGPHRHLACEGGNGKAVFAKAIAYTDFPLPEIRLYYTDRTILLPSEC
jgi:uncharacterized protein DUF6876